MTAPIITAAQALDGLLRAAEDGGLPMPYTVTVSDYAPSGHEKAHERIGGLSIGVDTLVDLTAWATWLDSTIDDTSTSAKNRHHNAYGYAGPVPVNVYALTSLRDEVSA